jgi:hypothetical protein
VSQRLLHLLIGNSECNCQQRKQLQLRFFFYIIQRFGKGALNKLEFAPSAAVNCFDHHLTLLKRVAQRLLCAFETCAGWCLTGISFGAMVSSAPLPEVE